MSRRLAAKLATLAACTAKLDSPGRLGIWLSVESLSKTTVSVWRSEVKRCEVAACLKRELTALELPPTDEQGAAYRATLELSPHSPPRQVPEASVDWQEEAKHCIEPELEARPGRLPPEEIQRIIRTHYDVFRTCYEAGLANNPRLGGRISIGFVIGRDGRVRRPHVVESTLPDCTVSACVRRRFESIAFPPPEGGVVTVIYPLMLEPG